MSSTSYSLNIHLNIRYSHYYLSLRANIVNLMMASE